MKEYLKPIIMVKKIDVEDVLASSSKFTINDTDPTWDGDIFGEK